MDLIRKIRITQRKGIYPLLGDTSAQRKQFVGQLLKGLGFQIEREQVRQNKGTLSILFLPPFPEQLWPRLEQLRKTGRRDVFSPWAAARSGAGRSGF